MKLCGNFGETAEVLRVAHYLNQFFAGVGGEEVADTPPQTHRGAIGPGRLLESLVGGDGGVVSTLLCGDSFFNEHADDAHEAVRVWLDETRPDLVLAGPAFAA